MVNKKHIMAIDLILVIGSLLVIAAFVGYSRPMVIAPIDNLKTSNGSVLFSFEKANLILIDDNPEFTSPREIYTEDNLVINLKPGVYYWKIQGALGSEIRQLTIESEIDLRLRESEESYEIVNAGSGELNVDVYENGKFTGNIILEGEESEQAFGDKFIGRENE